MYSHRFLHSLSIHTGSKFLKKDCLIYKCYGFTLYSLLDHYFTLHSLKSLVFWTCNVGFCYLPLFYASASYLTSPILFVFLSPFEKTLPSNSLTDQTHCIFCSFSFISPWLLQRILVDWRDVICLYSSHSVLSLPCFSSWWPALFSDKINKQIESSSKWQDAV